MLLGSAAGAPEVPPDAPGACDDEAAFTEKSLPARSLLMLFSWNACTAETSSSTPRTTAIIVVCFILSFLHFQVNN